MLKFIGDKDIEEIKEGFLCPFVYLHGKLEDINKYDLVKLSEDTYDSLPLNEEIPCIAVIDGKEYEAKGFFWENPIHKTGLICAIDDIESIKDAQLKQKTKAFC